MSEEGRCRRGHLGPACTVCCDGDGNVEVATALLS
jgi:hypothetical protein